MLPKRICNKPDSIIIDVSGGFKIFQMTPNVNIFSKNIPKWSGTGCHNQVHQLLDMQIAQKAKYFLLEITPVDKPM